MDSIFSKIAELENSDQNVALCIIINTKGSTPRKMGAKMVVFEDGKIFGTIGGGSLEKKVIENAIKVIKEKNHNLFDKLGHHDDFFKK